MCKKLKHQGQIEKFLLYILIKRNTLKFYATISILKLYFFIYFLFHLGHPIYVFGVTWFISSFVQMSRHLFLYLLFDRRRNNGFLCHLNHETNFSIWISRKWNTSLFWDYNTTPHAQRQSPFYLAAPRPTLGHYWGDSLIHLMLITTFLQFWPEGLRDLRNEVGSVSPADYLVRFEPENFRF